MALMAARGTRMLETAREFGAWLRDVRRDAGYNQAAFARVTGIEQSLLSKYERGKVVPDPANCRAIARALDLTEDEVLLAAGHRTGGRAGGLRDLTLDELVRQLMRRLPEIEERTRQIRDMADRVSTSSLSREIVGSGMMGAEAIGPDEFASGQAYDVETVADIDGAFFDPDGRRGFEAIFVPKSRLRHPESRIVGLRFRGAGLGPGLHHGVSILVEQTEDWRIGDRVLARHQGRFYCRVAGRRNGSGIVLLPVLAGDTEPPLRAEEAEIIGLVPAVLLWA